MNPITNHHPRKPRLDPDRDFRIYPAKWDLSSLPEPSQFAGGHVDSQGMLENAGQMSEASARFFADLQLDPFLDGEGEPPKRDCSIY